MSEELKPCPFCGDGGMIVNRTTGEGLQFLAVCQRGSCSARGMWFYEEPEAFAFWNTRDQSPSAPTMPVPGEEGLEYFLDSDDRIKVRSVPPPHSAGVVVTDDTVSALANTLRVIGGRTVNSVGGSVAKLLCDSIARGEIPGIALVAALGGEGSK